MIRSHERAPSRWVALLAVAFFGVVPAGVAVDIQPASAADAPTCDGRPATIIGNSSGETIVGTAGNDVIVGNGGNDTIRGGAGDDAICASWGYDHLYGDAGNDVLIGRDGKDDLRGGAGDDVLYGGPDDGLGDSNDSLIGGTGIDELSLKSSPTKMQVDLLANRAVGAGQGTDFVIEIENITGSRYSDSLAGDQFDNRIVGLGGSDLLFGWDGNDQLADNSPTPAPGVTTRNDYFGGLGDDVIFGGREYDVLNYSVVSNAVTVDLGAASATGEGNDIVSAIDAVIGTKSSDTISGDGFDNALYGGGGIDTLNGAGGNDLLEGGLGGDVLNGGSGSDDRVTYAYTTYGGVVVNLPAAKVFADDYVDNLVSIEGAIGGGFDDQFIGDGAANTFDPGPGADSVDGAGGSDWIQFLSAPGAVTVDLAAGTATGQGGDTFTSIENARGSPAGDVIRGTAGPNRLVGGYIDLLQGRGGNDVLEGVSGQNATGLSYASAPTGVTLDLVAGTATGGDGNDTINFRARKIVGSAHDDRITCGQVAEPFVYCDVDAGRGNDIVNGGPGDDNLKGNLGNDTLDGRDGADTADFSLAVGVIANLASKTATGQGNDTIANFEKLLGSSVDDHLIGGPDNDTFSPGRGDDFVQGNDGDDFIFAVECLDLSVCPPGDDRFEGGTGLNSLWYDGFSLPLHIDLTAGTVTGDGNDEVALMQHVYAGYGDDTIVGNAQHNELYGGFGDDTIAGRGGGDILDAGDDTDTIDMSGFGFAIDVNLDLEFATGASDATDFENIIGSSFNDTLIGDSQSNVIDGRAGTDTCDGRGGADTLLNCP